MSQPVPTPATAARPRRWTALSLAAGAALLAGTALTGVSSAATSTTPAATTFRMQLGPSSPALAACFPQAHAHVAVVLSTDDLGKDTFRVRAENLKPWTSFTVFLLEQSGAPFGAAEYLGDVTTDAYGDATGTFTAIVQEAFAFNGASQARTDLDAVGMWFADPKSDNGCLGAASPVTGFDGDASAGVQMLNSGTVRLP